MTTTFKASDIDRKFDAGEDVTDYFDMTQPIIRDGGEPRKVNLTLPEWMVARLDVAAKNLAISRNAVINVWLAERIEAESRHARQS